MERTIPSHKGSPSARRLKDWETRVLTLLLAQEFPGSQALRRQLETISVRQDATVDPTFVAFHVLGDVEPAVVRGRIPVEAVFTENDGGRGHILLHIVEGNLAALEMYREDGRPILSLPNPENLRILILGNPEGWLE